MFNIKTSASTSNLGIGFDCLGLAFDIFNCFRVNENDSFLLTGIEESYNNENNLFLQAYSAGCKHFGKEKPIHVDFDCNVPISRGLGSSSTFIVGGLVAAYLMNKESNLDKDIIFELAANFEGHPDNVAPCIYGGLSASSKLDNGKFFTTSLPLSNEYKFTCLIPDFKVSTEEARKALPDSYPKSIAVNSISKAIISTKAFENGDLKLLKSINKDEIHEPYRKALINDFNELEMCLNNDNNGILLISGSGSTCLYISKDELIIDEDKLAKLKNKWEIRKVKPYYEGVTYEVLL